METREIVLQNKFVTLKIDPKFSFAITHLSETSRPSVLNTSDLGRAVQSSIYGAEGAGVWRGYPWPYNPVQAGSAKNVSSNVVLTKKLGSSGFLSKVQAIDWSTSLMTDTFFTQRVQLAGPLVYVDYTMDIGNHSGPVRDQELPAVFVKSSYDTLITKSGVLKPTWNEKPPYGQYYDMPDGFAALVNKANYGIGVSSSVAKRLTTYLYPGKASCSYVAPLEQFALTPGLSFRHTTIFAVGLLPHIKSVLKV